MSSAEQEKSLNIKVGTSVNEYLAKGKELGIPKKELLRAALTIFWECGFQNNASLMATRDAVMNREVLKSLRDKIAQENGPNIEQLAEIDKHIKAIDKIILELRGEKNGQHP